MATDTKWWIIQQGYYWFVQDGKEAPDLKVPDGERRKALHGFFPEKEQAIERAKSLAAHYHGEYRDNVTTRR